MIMNLGLGLHFECESLTECLGSRAALRWNEIALLYRRIQCWKKGQLVQRRDTTDSVCCVIVLVQKAFVLV